MRYITVRNVRNVSEKGVSAFLVVLILSLVAIAQPGQEEMLKNKAAEEIRLAELQAAVSSSESAKKLKEAVDSGNNRAILEVASDDNTVIPYLRILASNIDRRTRRHSSSFYAHAVLAKRGDKLAFKTILSEIESTNFAVQDSAIEKLALVSSKASYQRLFELLDETTERVSSEHDLAWGSKSRATMSFLSQTVVDPPRDRERYSVEAWKAWFERNRHLIE